MMMVLVIKILDNLSIILFFKQATKVRVGKLEIICSRLWYWHYAVVTSNMLGGSEYMNLKQLQVKLVWIKVNLNAYVRLRRFSFILNYLESYSWESTETV